MLSKLGEIRRDDKCLDYAGGRGSLGAKDKIADFVCHGQQGNQNWWMEEDGTIHHDSGFCLEMCIYIYIIIAILSHLFLA
jgi:polypeptide N-acetylgalactosaminyltransferase